MSEKLFPAEKPHFEQAMFGAGCFWGVQLAFSRREGVTETVVGYSGGQVTSPDYKQVCTGTTGHAEVVWLRFDPKMISYRSLVEAFFALHDPTQLNRQGPDIGTQYRSAIFTYGEAQAAVAKEVLKTLQATLPRPIVTEILPAGEFWPAEEYHQHYFAKRGITSGCHG
jgi:peptide-methionine (S)-S-oxide reductase